MSLQMKMFTVYLLYIDLHVCIVISFYYYYTVKSLVAYNLQEFDDIKNSIDYFKLEEAIEWGCLKKFFIYVKFI